MALAKQKCFAPTTLSAGLRVETTTTPNQTTQRFGDFRELVATSKDLYISNPPDPSTAKPMTTEYNQKSLNSFCRRGLASLIGGSLLVNCGFEKQPEKKKKEKNVDRLLWQYFQAQTAKILDKLHIKEKHTDNIKQTIAKDVLSHC